MPIVRSSTVFEVARSLSAFLHLQAGVTRSQAPIPGLGVGERGELERVRRRLARSNEKVAALQAELSGNGAGADGIRPENIVWIFGFGRSGSTWLARMMGGLQNHVMWSEPLIGALFGNYFYFGVPDTIRQGGDFVLGGRAGLRPRLVRSFFLEASNARFSRASSSDILIVKEPNGSVGAPLLMEALPESRMVLLVRDPRDVVSSALEALDEGGWVSERLGLDGLQNVPAETWAGLYLQHLGKAAEAYDAHKGRKVLVRYEDLVADTLGTMKRVYSELGLEVDQKELTRTVEKHSWANVPEDQKGPGKFFRKGTSGGWKEDLTAEQVEVVERITAPILSEFYPS